MEELEEMDEDSHSVVFQEDSDSADESSSSSAGSTSEDSNDDVIQVEWSSVDSRQKFPFTDTPEMHVGSAKSPADYFKLLFSNTFMNFLVSSINLHAIQMLSSTGKSFELTNVDEVYTLLAVYFLMGFIRVNHMDFYWNAHPLFNLKFENFTKKDRFLLLLRALAYKKRLSYDDIGDSRRSWYDAAKPFADMFNNIMKSLVVAKKELNIDKYTAHWFNELNFAKRKPERIRMHLLSDSNGIFQRVYLNHPDGKNRSDEVLNYLLKDFVGTGRSIYTCPFYTNVTIAEQLLEKKTYMTGILKRKKPRNPCFTRKKLKIGGVKYLFNGKGVCVCNARKTHHTILALSTEHSGKVDVGRSADTEIIMQYKKHSNMFKRNQALSDNAPSEPSKKYNRTILYLLQVMFINAHLLYNANHEEKLSFNDFRKAILYDILPLPSVDSDSDDETEDLMGEPTSFGEVIHLPAEFEKNARRSNKNCRHCFQERGVRKSTNIFCPQCPRKWGLCLECFRDFHNY